jgi:hypothetical protein
MMNNALFAVLVRQLLCSISVSCLIAVLQAFRCCISKVKPRLLSATGHMSALTIQQTQMDNFHSELNVYVRSTLLCCWQTWRLNHIYLIRLLFFIHLRCRLLAVFCPADSPSSSQIILGGWCSPKVR